MLLNKRVFTLIYISLLLLVSSSSFAKRVKRENPKDYQELFLGEYEIDDYFGVDDLEVDINYRSREARYKNRLRAETNFNHIFGNGLTELEKNILNFHDPALKCSDYHFGESYEYIRYLFRLVTISYIFENIKEYHLTMYRLGLDRFKTSISWKKTFYNCKPKTIEMKKFLKRVKPVYLNALNKALFRKMKKDEIKKWIKNIKSQINSGEISSLFMDDFLERKEVLSLADIEKTIISAYKRDLDLIFNLCSERDDLFGMSYVDLAKELVKSTNAISVINKNLNAKMCIDRFVNFFSKREMRYIFLKKVFKVHSTRFLKNKVRYQQGHLFVPGAMKEFDDKGLTDFLFAIHTPTPMPSPLPTPERIIVKLTPTPTSIPTPIKIVVTSTPSPSPTATPLPRVSAFEKAVKKRIKKNLLKVAVNMKEFKKDFSFSKNMMKNLKKRIKSYETRVALSDMKKLDKLGSKRGAIRLIFLKYLIDSNSHQGLYNIQAVIGKKFYLINDIDQKVKPVFVEIENSKATKHQWQIYILKEKPKGKRK